MGLRRAEAVETGGIIRPLGIAEIGRAATQGVGPHRSPRGIGQVRGGFHHDDLIVGPGDDEPKPIRPHAEAGIAGLHQRLPQHRRTIAEGRPPTRGSRQVIDGRIGGVHEHIKTVAGRVTLEIDSCQVGAVSKRKFADAGDAVPNRYVGQAGAVKERLAPDAVDTVGDRDAGQAGAKIEPRVPNAGDAVGDRVAPSFAPRTLDEQGLALVEQDPIHTAIDGVERIHRDRAQAAAIKERLSTDARDAGGDGDVGQAGAVKERRVPNAGDAVPDCDTGQVGAGIERKATDADDAAGNRDAGQPGAGREPREFDVGDGAGNRIASSLAAGALEEISLVFVEQNSICAAVG